MAVIREKRQYMAQPIGVVRADFGSDMVDRGIGQLADTLIQGSYKGLVERAEKTGAEVAQAVSNVRTINPETGMPESCKRHLRVFILKSLISRMVLKTIQSVCVIMRTRLLIMRFQDFRIL